MHDGEVCTNIGETVINELMTKAISSDSACGSYTKLTIIKDFYATTYSEVCITISPIEFKTPIYNGGSVFKNIIVTGSATPVDKQGYCLFKAELTDSKLENINVSL